MELIALIIVFLLILPVATGYVLVAAPFALLIITTLVLLKFFSFMYKEIENLNRSEITIETRRMNILIDSVLKKMNHANLGWCDVVNHRGSVYLYVGFKKQDRVWGHRTCAATLHEAANKMLGKFSSKNTHEPRFLTQKNFRKYTYRNSIMKIGDQGKEICRIHV